MGKTSREGKVLALTSDLTAEAREDGKSQEELVLHIARMIYKGLSTKLLVVSIFSLSVYLFVTTSKQHQSKCRLFKMKFAEYIT